MFNNSFLMKLGGLFMRISELSKWFYVAKGLEKCGLLKSSDWKNIKVITKSYQNKLVQKVLKAAEELGRNDSLERR